MKQVIFGTLAGVSMAVDTATLSALMQWGTFPLNNPLQAPFSNQNSNTDPVDIKRQNPDFASPFNNGPRQPVLEENRLMDGLTAAQRKAQAAIKDPSLGHLPQVRQLFADVWEPIDPQNKRFVSPVFIVDPEFNGEQFDWNKGLFRDNDHGGWRQPVAQSHFPFVQSEVRQYFGVVETCKCHPEKQVFVKWPTFTPLAVPVELFGEIYEPQYENPSY